MSVWQTVMTTMVRHLINDVDLPYKYDDQRVMTSIIIAGLQSSLEYSYDSDYVFDIEALDITPDPAASDTYDPVAMALMTLKAACIFDTNRYQGGVSQGIRVRDGDSEVDTTAGFTGYKDILLLGPCASYQKLLDITGSAKSMKLGRAIMTPISHVDFTGSYAYNSVERFFNNFRVV